MDEYNIIGIVLIIINVIITQMGFRNHDFFRKYLFSPHAILNGKQYFRILSSGFLHVDWVHLMFNMMTLYFFSDVLEMIFGWGGYLFIYFGSLVGGNLLSLLINKDNRHYTAVGASGAISGMVFAFIAIAPDTGLRLILLPVDFPAWVYGIAFVGISIFGISRQRDNIGHDAHLGGAIVGMLLAIILVPEALQRNLLVILGTLIPALIFLLIILRKRTLKAGELFKGNKRDFGYTMDDRYNREKRMAAEELDALLEKVSKSGYQSLSNREKERLDELSGGNG